MLLQAQGTDALHVNCALTYSIGPVVRLCVCMDGTLQLSEPLDSRSVCNWVLLSSCRRAVAQVRSRYTHFDLAAAFN
jgi:hypothetical protein